MGRPILAAAAFKAAKPAESRLRAELPAPRFPTIHAESVDLKSHILFNPAPPVAGLSSDFCLLLAPVLLHRHRHPRLALQIPYRDHYRHRIARLYAIRHSHIHLIQSYKIG